MNLRGSEIGRCHQYLAIKALGLPLEQPPSYLQKIFDAGNRQEDEAIAWLEEHTSVEVVDRQREVVYKVGEHTVTGHPDGIEVVHGIPFTDIDEPDYRYVLEIKALSQERFAYLWGDKLEPAIVDQVAAYCLALLQEGDEIEGFVVLGKLWEKEQYHLYRLSGDGFTSWLDVQQEKIEQTVAKVAELAGNIQTRVTSIEKSREMVMSPWGYASDIPACKSCRECAARYHCYPKLLEEEAAILKNTQLDAS